VHITPLPAGYEHAYYRFEFRLNPHKLRADWNRDRIMMALRCEGIPCLVGSCPEIYREGAYANASAGFRRLPNAAYLAGVSLAIPINPMFDKSFLRDCRNAFDKVFSSGTI
jgi:dTDP-4-amino-4,6-dideoxygalactose transaminase